MAVPAGADRADFPSTATGISPVASHAARIHRPNAAANASGSSLANTRSNVSGLGTPLANGMCFRRNDSLAAPYAAMASHVSAPAMIPHVAIVRMSARAWSLFFVSRRGSGRSANTVARGNAGMGHPPDPLGVVANPYAVTGS